MNIITNHTLRPFLSFHELTDKEAKSLSAYPGHEESTFFKYKGHVYDLSDFLRLNLKGWDGVLNETFFSGVVVKLKSEGVIVGRYF